MLQKKNKGLDKKTEKKATRETRRTEEELTYSILSSSMNGQNRTPLVRFYEPREIKRKTDSENQKEEEKG